MSPAICIVFMVNSCPSLKWSTNTENSQVSLCTVAELNPRLFIILLSKKSWKKSYQAPTWLYVATRMYCTMMYNSRTAIRSEGFRDCHTVNMFMGFEVTGIQEINCEREKVLERKSFIMCPWTLLLSLRSHWQLSAGYCPTIILLDEMSHLSINVFVCPIRCYKCKRITSTHFPVGLGLDSILRRCEGTWQDS